MTQTKEEDTMYVRLRGRVQRLSIIKQKLET